MKQFILKNKIYILTFFILLLSSCQSYKPMVLNPEEVLSDLENQRTTPIGGENFSFVDAAQLMSENNLELKRIKQTYKSFKSVSDIKTPWPNPELEFGPAHGDNLSEKTASATQPFVGVGFTIPLGPRLRRNDELNQLKTLKAYNEQVITHRELYFELKKAYVRFSLANKLQTVQSDIKQVLAINRKSTEKMKELGTVTSLSVNSIKLSQAEFQLQEFNQKIYLHNEVNKLSRLLSLSPSLLQSKQTNNLPKPEVTMDLKTLKKQLISNSLNLSRSEMDFHLSDAKLRLELAEQYPDLKVGFTSEDEVGEDKRTFSIPFSIELPIFDRNQQAIAQADSERHEMIALYKEKLNNSLSNLETLHAQYLLCFQKLSFIRESLIPLAKQNTQDAEKSFKLGAISPLRYLDLLADLQQLNYEKVQQENECWMKLLEIESLVGLPLVKLSDKPLEPLKKALKKQE